MMSDQLQYPSIQCSCGRLLINATNKTKKIRCTCGETIEVSSNSPQTQSTPPCPHLIDTTCHAVLPMTPSQETCRACTALGRGINDITVLEVINQLKDAGEEVPDYLYQYLKKPERVVRTEGSEQESFSRLQYGPGTNLKYLLSWFVNKPANCACDDRVKLMNLWGKKKCLESLPIILGWLRESALDNNIKYNEFVVSLIVKLAIRTSLS